MGKARRSCRHRLPEGVDRRRVARTASIAGYGWLSLRIRVDRELERRSSRERRGNIHLGTLHALSTPATGRAPRPAGRDPRASPVRGHEEGWIGSVAIPAERAFGPSGFNPALTMTSVKFAGFHWLAVTAGRRSRSRPGGGRTSCPYATSPRWYLCAAREDAATRALMRSISAS